MDNTSGDISLFRSHKRFLYNSGSISSKSDNPTGLLKINLKNGFANWI